MKKFFVATIVILIISLLIELSSEAFAQSGRRREPKRPTPATKPKQPEPPPVEKPTKPPADEKPVEPVGKGGAVAKREFDPDTATSRITLENGLTLIVREKYSKPLVAITACVKVGRFDEPDERLGLAELVNRLLLRGTTTRPGSQATGQLRTLGGVVDSRTDGEQTVYSIVVPAEKLKQAIEIQADILQHPAFDAEALSREIELLVQEYRAQGDDLSSQAFRSMLELALPSHPIRRLPISEDGLRAITREKLLEFYQTHYRPEKVILVAVGAVSPQAVLEPVRQAYGAWVTADLRPQTSDLRPQTSDLRPRRPATSDQRPATSDQQLTASDQRPATSDQLRYGQLEKDIHPALASIGYRIEASPPAEVAKLEVLLTVLGRGRASRLGRAWREGDPLIRDFKIDYMTLKDVGLLWVQLWAAPENLNNAELSFFKEIGRLRRQIISPGELQRAKSLLERRFWDRRAMLDQEAEALAWYEAMMGDYRWADRYLTTVRTMTAEQLQQIAARYLTLTKVVIYELQPKQPLAEAVTAESVAGWITSRAPGAGETEISAKQITQAEAVLFVEQGQPRQSAEKTETVLFSLQPEPIRDYSVLQGPRAYVRVDQSLPTISIGLFIQGGRLFEDASNNGITELMLRAMLKGARSKWEKSSDSDDEEMPVSASYIAMKLEQLGAEVTVVNEADYFGYILNMLSRNQEQALKLLIDIFERPTFDETEVLRERAALLAEIEQSQGDTVNRSADLMWSALVGTHPYGLPRLGRKETVQNLTAAQISAWYKKTIGQQYPLVMIVGDTDGSALISSVIARGISRGEVQESFRAAIPQAPPQPRQLVESAQARFTSQTFGFLGPAGQSPDNEVLDVMAHLLCGAGGRLTDELRNQQAVAYEVQAVNHPGLLAGAFLMHLNTSPENETRARDMLQREVEKLLAGNVTDEELSLGINAAIGSSAYALQYHPRRALEYAQLVLFGRHPKEVESYAERIRAVTKEKIRAITSDVLKWNQHALGVVRGQH